MYSTEHTNSGNGRLKHPLGQALRLLGSLKLAVFLLVVLAVTIAVATVLEAERGRAYAQWYVYHSRWFIAILTLLGVTIFSAAASRWPWKRHQTGFVITHAGLLILLAGSLRSFRGGVEGQVTLRVGETTTKMTVPNRAQLAAVWAGRPDEAPYEFSFEHGPVDWGEGRSLNLGEIDGVSARVLRFLHHAEAVEDWVPDETGQGGPAIKFKVDGPGGKDNLDYTLVDQDYGDEVFAGPVRVQLRQAGGDAMVGDFLTPPKDKLGDKGLLLAYHENRSTRIPIAENIGKRVPLAGTSASVEIVQYLANARPDPHGNFQPGGEAPGNPLLELRVHLANEKKVLRQWAFAKSPLLTLDPIYGQDCPVRFEYLHPAVKQPMAIDFLQAADGTLYARFRANNELVFAGAVKLGERVRLSDRFGVTLVEHFPHARERVTFKPVKVEANQAEKPEAAMEVAVSVGGSTQTTWLQRNHPTFGSRTLTTPRGALRVKFGYAEAPLGFPLTLVKFRRERNPGGVGNASFSSVVRVGGTGKDEEREISMNQPLTHNQLTFYQSGFNEGGQGVDSSTFSVAYDPGRGLKYAGSLMICLGIATMFFMKAYFFKNTSLPVGRWSRIFWRWRNNAPVPPVPGLSEAGHSGPAPAQADAAPLVRPGTSLPVG
jgi:hypothetical protein